MSTGLLICNSEHNIVQKQLTILISFQSNRPSCLTCSANCTDLCLVQLPSLSNDAPSNAGLADFFLIDDDDAILLLLIAVVVLLLLVGPTLLLPDILVDALHMIVY